MPLQKKEPRAFILGAYSSLSLRLFCPGRLRGCWGDGGKSPEGPTCASHFANPATAIRDGQHILEHCEPLPEIDDPVTLVTLTVAKMVATLDRWIEGVLP